MDQANQGAVILHALREDGLLASAAITQLPSWAANAPATLLRADHGEVGILRLVLNQPGENFHEYVLQEDPGSHSVELPVLLERKSDTIPIFHGSGEYIAGRGIQFRGVLRKRLAEEQNDGNNKRTRQE